jgi:hypothetical protein
MTIDDMHDHAVYDHNAEIDQANQRLNRVSNNVYSSYHEALKEVSKVLALYGLILNHDDVSSIDQELIYKIEQRKSEETPEEESYYLYIAISHFVTTEIYAQIISHEELNDVIEETKPLEYEGDKILPSIQPISNFLRQTRRSSDF